jgi:16S rRNA (guanine1516-N2)-methyltransferase
MAAQQHIALVVEAKELPAQQHARNLSQQLGIDLFTSEEFPHASDELVLVQTDDRLELRLGRMRASADLTDVDPAIRSGRAGRSGPLIRALGKNIKTVVDATAGFGGDAVLMACMGFQVLAIERSPIIFAVLADGVQRARNHPELGSIVRDRLTVQRGDAQQVLHEMVDPPDAVFIDPMFPPKRKTSALARKSVRMIRAVVGNDPDAAELLAVARAVAQHRVVVKRPDDAEPLAPNPTITFPGSTVRYDVYVRTG